MKTYTCKSCGYTAESPDEAKFCQQCGAKLVEDISQPAPALVVRTIQGNTRAEPRMVMGPIIKEHLMAQLVEEGIRKNGKFEVRTDGVLYVTSSRFGNKVVQIPVEDIASVGLGESDKILVIRSKSGYEMHVKMGGAQRWIPLIKQQMH